MTERGFSQESLGDLGVGKSNENGTRLIEECALNGWSIASSYFNAPERKKWTFYGSFRDGDGKFRREYDHIVCDKMTRKRVVRLNCCNSNMRRARRCQPTHKLRFFEAV